MICFSLNLLFLKLSFQEWTQQVQDMLNTKKFGDISFRDKDFKNAIENYSKVFSYISSGGLIIISMYEWGLTHGMCSQDIKKFTSQNDSHGS